MIEKYSDEFKDRILLKNSIDISNGISTPEKVIASHLQIVDRAIRLIKAGFTKDIEVEIALAEMATMFATECTVDADTIDACVAEAHNQIDNSGLGKYLMAADLANDIFRFYDSGYDSGLEIMAWPEFSSYFKVAKKEVTIVTGIPGHGKSEFVDMLMIMLGRYHKLKFGIFSPENYPHEIHIEKLLSKIINKPFHKVNYGLGRERMTISEISMGLAKIHDYFHFIVPDETDISLDAVLSIALRIKEKNGLDFLLIDPWNELEGNRDKGETETDYIGKCLMKCRRFARQHDIAFFIVAHPMKLQKDKEGVRPLPTPYDISGSSHWFNKADNCLCVYRLENEVQVHIQKIKFKIRGQIGMASFNYDKPTGVYTPAQISKEEFNERP